MARGIIEKTNETITTETFCVGNGAYGEKGLPFLATLENGETVNCWVIFPASAIAEILGGCTITWKLDGYKKAITSKKREWNRIAKEDGDPKIMKLKLRAC